MMKQTKDNLSIYEWAMQTVKAKPSGRVCIRDAREKSYSAGHLLVCDDCGDGVSNGLRVPRRRAHSRHQK